MSMTKISGKYKINYILHRLINYRVEGSLDQLLEFVLECTGVDPMA